MVVSCYSVNYLGVSCKYYDFVLCLEIFDFERARKNRAEFVTIVRRTVHDNVRD